MSAARELFLEFGPLRIASGDGAYGRLARAADLWRRVIEHFSFGLATVKPTKSALSASGQIVPPPAVQDRVSSIIEAPRGEHSAKPEIVYALIEKFYPTLPKIERPGPPGLSNGSEQADAPFSLGLLFGNGTAAAYAAL
jgi:hypothetical protein